MGACEMASLVLPLRARHVTLLARLMPSFKSKPQGPRPNPRLTKMMTWTFSLNPCPNPSPYPIVLS
ncbi:hypothetical protein Hanom_Chr10g00932971 [Helianthus anomalus]